MDKIILTTFTDPMMGLSYEQEPVYEKLAAHYGDQLEFRYVMAGLVRDVSDFMLPSELALPPEDGIRIYNKRLTQIYLDEESIGGLPMNMDGFHLFDENHRSSYPLCTAYKAAQLTDSEKAYDYLKRLRRATILESRQTTLKEEQISAAREVGIDEADFLRHLDNRSAQEAFHEDLQFTRSLGIHALPACLIQCENRAIITRGMMDYDAFIAVLEKILSDE